MKNLQNLVEEKQTKLFNETKTFFAFSDKQLQEGKIKYGFTSNKMIVSVGVGMFCSKEKRNILLEGLEKIRKEGIKEDISLNGIDNIISWVLCPDITFPGSCS